MATNDFFDRLRAAAEKAKEHQAQRGQAQPNAQVSEKVQEMLRKMRERAGGEA